MKNTENSDLSDMSGRFLMWHAVIKDELKKALGAAPSTKTASAAALAVLSTKWV